MPMNPQPPNPHADVLAVTRFLDRLIADYGAELFVGFFYLSIIVLTWIILRAINHRQQEKQAQRRLAEIQAKRLLAEEILAEQIIAQHSAQLHQLSSPAPQSVFKAVVPPLLPHNKA